MLQKNGTRFACVFLHQKDLQIINNRTALNLFEEINVKIHPKFLKLYMCFRMLKIAAILSHLDIFEITSDKNQEQKANYKLFCKKSDN